VAHWIVKLPDNNLLEDTLAQGLEAMQLAQVAGLSQKLLQYLELLQRWNGAYNLTAIRDPLQMVSRHVLDSLAVAAFLPADAKRLIDVGTGAGLPGIPLALLNPHQHYDLLDSNGKKTRFLFQVKTALGLDNISVHSVRAESWHPPQPYDVVLSRAFASLSDMLTCCRHFCAESGIFLAMKGTLPEAELAAIAHLSEIRQIHELQVPGLEEDRHLIELGLPQQSSQGNKLG
jgi:16S rRNA (guanine527-N7)-methyltransferase